MKFSDISKMYESSGNADNDIFDILESKGIDFYDASFTENKSDFSFIPFDKIDSIKNALLICIYYASDDENDSRIITFFNTDNSLPNGGHVVNKDLATGSLIALYSLYNHPMYKNNEDCYVVLDLDILDDDGFDINQLKSVLK